MVELKKKIEKLKKEKNAVILAHNYQLPEIQDVADFVGDSLELSRKAAQTDADVIVFCGVHFMAETASIISPEKKVLLPDINAGCSLAESIDADALRNWRLNKPDAVVVSYINTSAEIKALSDYCCTSSNALKIVESIPPEKEILFLPDKYLGGYVKAKTKRENISVWDGACHVHQKIGDVNFQEKKKSFPDAEFLIHPECGCSTSCMLRSLQYQDESIHIFSTSGMINYVNESPKKQFVIATEVGILYRMQKNNPDKMIVPANENSICEYMKLTTLEKLYSSLLEEKFEVKVDASVASRARKSIEKMLSIA